MSQRILGLISAFLIAVLILSSPSFYSVVFAGNVPGQGEVAVVGKINVGDVIEVTYDSVIVRKSANGEDTGQRIYKGDTGVVQGGPESAGGLTWWYVTFPPVDYTLYGWVAEKAQDGTVLIKEKTNNNPPSKPTNQEPSNGATGVSLFPTLRASAFNDPDGDSQLKYWWEIRRVSDDVVVWGSDWRISNLASIDVPSDPQVLQPNTQYKWRMRYMDSKGAWSPVSEFTTFTTKAELLPAPTLYSPSNGATNVQIPVTFSWSSVSGANRYWLIISTDSNTLPRDPYATSAPGCKEYYTSSTSYTVSDLTPATTYYWEVQAFYIEDSQVKQQGEYSSIWSFTTAGAEQELQIVENFKVTVSQGGSATGTIKVYNPNDKDHYIKANSFVITDKAGFKGNIYATNLGSDLLVPAKGYATIEIKVEADADCPIDTYYPKYKITSDVGGG